MKFRQAFHADHEWLKAQGIEDSSVVMFEFIDESKEVDPIFYTQFISKRGEDARLIPARLRNLANTIDRMLAEANED